MFASIKKIFSKDQDVTTQASSGAAPSASKIESETASNVETVAQIPPKKQGPLTSPLSIPRFAARDTGEGDLMDSDEEASPTQPVSMSCPLPGNRKSKFMPRRPVVKPARIPTGTKLPNLELPPSLPSNYVIPEPPQPMTIDNQSFGLDSFQYASSCPAAFRLEVNGAAIPIGSQEYVRVEGTPMAKSPLIYEVLLSRCLIPPARPTHPYGSQPSVPLIPDLADQHVVGSIKDIDDLPDMEL